MRACLLACIAALSCLAGCASNYLEPNVPSSETAILNVAHEDGVIEFVDDHPVPLRFATSTRVLPGIHRISLTQYRGSRTWMYALTVEFQKDHAYTLEPSAFEGKIAIRDDASGRLLVKYDGEVFTASTPPKDRLRSAPTAPRGSLVVPLSALPPEVLHPATSPTVPARAESPNEQEDQTSRPSIRIGEVITRTGNHYGQEGVWATAQITLNEVPGQTFTLYAVLVDDRGTPLKDRFGEFRNSTKVKTGDEEDTDSYSLFVPSGRLQTWPELPTVVRLQLTLVDSTGQVRATHAPITCTVIGYR